MHEESATDRFILSKRASSPIHVERLCALLRLEPPAGSVELTRYPEEKVLSLARKLTVGVPLMVRVMPDREQQPVRRFVENLTSARENLRAAQATGARS